MVQTPEQPSPGTALPSSHSSPLWIMPSPQPVVGGGFFAPESVRNNGGGVVPASLEADGIPAGFFPLPSPRTTVASPLQPTMIAEAPNATTDRHPKREDLKLTTRSLHTTLARVGRSHQRITSRDH